MVSTDWVCTQATLCASIWFPAHMFQAEYTLCVLNRTSTTPVGNADNASSSASMPRYRPPLNSPLDWVEHFQSCIGLHTQQHTLLPSKLSTHLLTDLVLLRVLGEGIQWGSVLSLSLMWSTWEDCNPHECMWRLQPYIEDFFSSGVLFTQELHMCSNQVVVVWCVGGAMVWGWITPILLIDHRRALSVSTVFNSPLLPQKNLL